MKTVAKKVVGNSSTKSRKQSASTPEAKPKSQSEVAVEGVSCSSDTDDVNQAEKSDRSPVVNNIATCK